MASTHQHFAQVIFQEHASHHSPQFGLPETLEPSTYSLQKNIDEWEIKFIETPSRLDHYTPEQVKENLVRYIDRTKSPRRKEIKSSQNYLLIILVFSFVGYLREQTLKKQKNE